MNESPNNAQWLPRAVAVQEFFVDGPVYPAALALREQVLRIPLGRRLDKADLADEDRQFHLGAFMADALIGCVAIKPFANRHQAKLRQMAVADSARGRGVGKALAMAAEAVARERGIGVLELSARQSALGFYQKLGYRALGALYLELDIPHIKMIKTIA